MADDQPSYVVVRSDIAPSLGSNDDPAWRKANVALISHYHSQSSAHQPNVVVRCVHDGVSLYLQFDVEDRHVLGRNTDSNSPVYRDSCVEFFLQIVPNLYTNFEVNCLGALLVGRWQEEPREGGEICCELVDSIRRSATLSTRGCIDTELATDETLQWRVELCIPFDLLSELHGQICPLPSPPEGGVASIPCWRCNFYKCADESSHPHWGSWAAIGEALNFHQPQYFGKLYFEA